MLRWFRFIQINILIILLNFRILNKNALVHVKLGLAFASISCLWGGIGREFSFLTILPLNLICICEILSYKTSAELYLFLASWSKLSLLIWISKPYIIFSSTGRSKILILVNKDAIKDCVTVEHDEYMESHVKESNPWRTYQCFTALLKVRINKCFHWAPD